MARKQFATLEVDGVEYKLKLKTSRVCKIEEKLGTSLINVLGTGGVPSLNVMLTILHGAMIDFNANVKRTDVDDIFDKYLEEGGSQMDFFSNVIMDIYTVSGFFTEAQEVQMEEKQEEMKDL